MYDTEHNVSNEAIDFQNDNIPELLTKWVSGMRDLFGKENKPSNKEVIEELKKLQGIIKKRFNIFVHPVLLERFWNAGINVPSLNLNTGAIPKGVNEYLNINEFYKSFEKELLKKPVGWVDLKKATVHGTFEEVPIILTIGLELLLDNRLTPKELASGIIMHEIGHIFDIFANVSQNESYTKGMSEIHRAMTGLSNPEERKVILEYLNLKNYVDVPHENIEKISRLDPDKAVQIIVTEHILKLRSQTGIDQYELKTAEQSADLFVARFGGSVEAVRALDKVNDASPLNTLKSSKKAHYAVQALQLTVGLMASVVFPIIPIIFIYDLATIGGEPDYNYDTEKERMDKLRQQLLVRLKNRDLDPKLRNSILEDVKTVNIILETYKDNVPFFTAFSRLVSKKTRARARQNELMYHLERMSNNKLYESAAKLKSLLS